MEAICEVQAAHKSFHLHHAPFLRSQSSFRVLSRICSIHLLSLYCLDPSANSLINNTTSNISHQPQRLCSSPRFVHKTIKKNLSSTSVPIHSKQHNGISPALCPSSHFQQEESHLPETILQNLSSRNHHCPRTILSTRPPVNHQATQEEISPCSRHSSRLKD